MTATLVAKDLSGGHDHRTLFSKLSLTVAPGDVVGVVGANGAGKSTLLRLLAGVDEPQEGTVSLAPADAFVGWLPQEHERIAGETVARLHRPAHRLRPGHRWTWSPPRRPLAAAPPAPTTPTPLRSTAGWPPAPLTWKTAIPAVLADLGLEVGQDAEMTGLSGGQAARVALAALLLSRFDIVLLDEPTNDLDLNGLAKLEAFVQGLRGGVVLVSHDREFLARCVTTIVELDLAQNSVAVYDGGYESYLEERAVARRHARERYEEFAATKADLVSRARTQREWSSQGVRNAMKKNPDNDKIRRAASTESSEKQGQKVRQMESRIARLEEVEEPRKEWQLQFSIGAGAPLQRRGGDPARRRRAAGRFHPGPGEPAAQRGGTDRHHRPQRRRQIHPAPAPAGRPAARLRRTPPWAPPWRSARSTRPAACWPAS